MAVLKKRDPLSDLLALQQQINKILEDRLNHGDLGHGLPAEVPAGGAWSPALDVYEIPTGLVARMELPGMREKEIEVIVEGGTLTIRGNRTRPSARNSKAGKRVSALDGEVFHRMEREFGSFVRTFTLPAGVDRLSLQTRYVDGVLDVRLSKSQSKPASKKKSRRSG
jgi:HSP20 family protein